MIWLDQMKIMNKIMKMLGKIIICLISDKMIGKIMWYLISRILHQSNKTKFH